MADNAVTCASCGAANASDHAFCSTCGVPLATACPNCGTENGPANKFCFSCGTNLATAEPTASASPAPTESSGEHRLVSVVFADLVGFTTFSEHRDPEDVRGMLTSYYEKCREIIGRFGGTTDKFIGDAVMGVWGAVEAHEDDAERSTRAALELVDMVEGLGSELGIPDLSARAGVLSGEASVGSGGNEHGLVVGDLVNTASRLQSIAPPGGVLAGESTKTLASHAIEFVEAGSHDVKGKSEQVAAYRAVRVVALSAARRSGDLAEGPFVGRDDELRILKDQLHATGREGRARMVSVIGEAGIGKTRLSTELLRYIDGITEDIYYHSGRSPSYGDGVTFWALGEMIRQRAGILEGEDPTKSRMKLRTAVAEYAPDEDEQRWIEPRLAAVIGLTDMPAGDKSELYAALRTFFQRIAERSTVLMVFEDLHWADEGLLDFVEELVDRTTQHPIMVIALSRPALIERRTDWGATRRRSLLMHLSRLHDEAMRELVVGLAPGLPDEVVARIADRTAGVPLHAVEFVRMLVNSGQLVRDGDTFTLVGEPGELSVPDTVAAIIGARLDRLTDDESSLIQDASVLGLSFTLGSIAQMNDTDTDSVNDTLLRLVRSDILELDEDPRSPERGQYRFVQGLILEVAYGRLSKSERVARHLEVARQFEALDDIELAGVIAGHYLSAANADPDNGELADRARTRISEAAERALSLHSYAQAGSLYQQAVSMTNDPGEIADLKLLATHSLEHSGRTDMAALIAGEAMDYYKEIGSADGIARSATAIASAMTAEFEAGSAADLIVPVYEATPAADTVVWVKLASQTARALMLAGRMDEALVVADQAMPVLERLGFMEDLLETLITRSTALANTGRWLEGRSGLMGAAATAADYDLLLQQIRALNNLESVSRYDIAIDMGVYEQMQPLLQKSGSEAWLSRHAFFRADAATLEGNLALSEELIDEGLSYDLSDFWINTLVQTRDRNTLLRDGFDQEVYDRFEAWNTSTLKLDDTQIREAAISSRIEGFLMAAQYADAVTVAGSVDPGAEVDYRNVPQLGLMAAGLAGDLEAAELIRSRIPPRPSYFRFTVGLEAFGDMVIAGLRGDADAAEAAHERCDASYSEAASQLDLALSRAVYAQLVGLDRASGATAAQRAFDFYSERGIQLWLDNLAHLFSGLVRAEDDETLAG
ncbi:MAG: AAA family ATPase [Acidimicrobiia bacterium]